MKKHQTFRVLAAIDLASVAGRQKLAGVYRFIAEGHDWDIELIRTREECTAERIATAASDSVDGFLMAIPESRAMHNLHKALGIPTTFIDYPDEATLHNFKKCVFIMDDTRDLCRTAVQALLSQGIFRSYCYAEARTPSRWSKERGDMFAKELSKRKVKMRRFSSEHSGNREHLTSWLLSLDRPAAILAAYDDTAKAIINVCKGIRLKIPEEIAVLGIGNDETVCLHSTPAISSIKPNFKEEGYRAARELQAMMIRHKAPVNRLFLCGGAEVAERGTTRQTSTVEMLVHDALAFIEENALHGISASDVAANLKVSRRLMDLRFRESTGTSVLQAILEKRLGEVCHLLTSTMLPISTIAIRCGYQNANYLKNLFKKHYGMSMRKWRNQNRLARLDT